VDCTRREIAREVVEKRAFAVERVGWRRLGRVVVVRRWGEGVVWCGGAWGMGVIGLGGGVDDMDVYGLIGPEGRDDKIPVCNVEFLEVLEVIEAREVGLDNDSDAALGGCGGVGIVLAVVVDGDEVLIGPEVTVNVVAEIGDVVGVVGTYFLEGSDAVAANNGLGDVVGILFEATNVG
jgi:hypothetical protein